MISSLLTVVLASAPGPVATLDFASVPATCREDALRSAVASRLGYDPFVPAAPVAVQVRVDGVSSLTARIVVSRPERAPSARTLVGPADCKTLTDALAFALAVAVDPLVLSRPPPPDRPATPVAVSPPPPPAVEAVVQQQPPAPVEVPPTRPRIDLRLLGNLELGAQPGAYFGLTAGARLGGAHVSLLVEALVIPPTTAATGASGLVDVFTVGLTVGGCGHVSYFTGCGLVRGAALRFQGRELTETREGWLPAFSVGARVGVEWPRDTALALTAGAEARVPLTRARLLVGEEVFWAQPFVMGSVGLGVLARLP